MTHQTQTQFTQTDLPGLLAYWRAEFEEHGLVVSTPRSGVLIGEADFVRLTLQAETSACSLLIEAPDLGTLPEMRAGIGEHMTEFAPDLPPLHWSGEFEAGAPPVSFSQAEVVACAALGASWWRMTLAADPSTLARFAGENWHFRLLRPASPDRPAIWPVQNAKGTLDWPEGADALTDRVFSTRHLDLDQGRLTFDIYRHPGGPTCDWAADHPLGQRVGLMGPGGRDGPTASRGAWLLAGGDETAVPAVMRALEACVEPPRGRIALLIRNADDCQAAAHPGAVTWLYRDQGATEADLVSLITNTPPPEGASVRLWFAASRDATRAVRRHAREGLGLRREDMLITAYWS